MAYPAILSATTALFLAAGYLVASDFTSKDLSLFLALFLAAAVLWGAAVFLARHRPPTWRTVLLGAVILRAALLPAGVWDPQNPYPRQILYDNDHWRYLWEAHAWSAGVNPLQTPAASLDEYELDFDDPVLSRRLYNHERWPEIWDNIGYREYASPYSLVAHAVFLVAHAIQPGSVLSLRLLLALFDIATVLLLIALARRLSLGPAAVIAYAWNPLVCKELVASAHIDAVIVFFLVLSAWSASAHSGWALGLASLVKPTPLALAPSLLRRYGWRAALGPAIAVILVAAFLPEGMKAYAQHWVFNPALPRLLPDSRLLQVGLSLGAVGLVAAWRFFWPDRSALGYLDDALWLFGTFLMTTPMLAPWYVSWILPFAALRLNVFWLTFSASVFLSYHIYLRFEEVPALIALEFAIPVLAWALATLYRRRALSKTSGAKPAQRAS